MTAITGRSTEGARRSGSRHVRACVHAEAHVDACMQSHGPLRVPQRVRERVRALGLDVLKLLRNKVSLFGHPLNDAFHCAKVNFLVFLHHQRVPPAYNVPMRRR